MSVNLSLEARGVDDLVYLEEINDKSTTTLLESRYKENNMNPFQLIKKNNVSIYSQGYIDFYNKKLIHEVPPHIFSIAEDAFRSLVNDRVNQCVIISGESGAGKTEASKQIMQFVTSVSKTTTSTKKDTVSSCLLASNPVLEAFGNAQTIRNNNSSRFGKYMVMQFNFLGDVVGGLITIYLLEKSRVIKQSGGERNFHIFYQLLQGASSALKSALDLKDPSYYSFLSCEYRKVPGVEDNMEFATVESSMTTVGITPKEQEHIWRLLSFILDLGNITFTKGAGDKTDILNKDALAAAAKKLAIEPSVLEVALVSRKLTMGVKRKSVQLVNLDIHGAETTRDTLSKALYERIFKWIVTRINGSIEKPMAHGQTTLGILDIYGFEIFGTNLFEQLCINFVNEKLQQIFIDLTLKQEQDEYDAEGIAWTPIDYFNNKIVCDLIEGKKPAGIMTIMDEQCALSEASDEVLLSKLHKGCASTNAHYIQPKIAGSTFTIKHYAGDVTYTCVGFIETNKDTLFNDLIELMTGSGSSYAKELFVDNRTEDEKAKKPPTTSMQFKKQVDSLMEALNQCNPHYVRCIKPNDTKKAGDFDFERTLHQVKYLGLVENIRIRRAGYCYRGKFTSFLQRFKMLSSKTWPNPPKGATLKDAVTSLLLDNATVHWYALSDKEQKTKLTYIQGDTFQCGRTKVFIKQPSALFGLENLRQAKLPYIVTKIQTCYRRFIARRRYKHMLVAFRSAQFLLRQYLDRKHKALKIQTCFRRWSIARKYRHKLLCFKVAQKLLRDYLDKKHKAIKVQKHFRRWRVRRLYRHKISCMRATQQLLRAFLDRKHKARKIQAKFRMMVLRRLYLHMRYCIRVAQRLVKEHVAKCRSAIKLQSKFKAFAEKKKYDKFYDRMTLAQARCRGVIVRRKFVKDKNAANKIKALYKGKKTRRAGEGRTFRETHGLVYFLGKERRRESFSVPRESGDSLLLKDNKAFAEHMVVSKKNPVSYGSKVLFSANLSKINRTWARDERNLAITDTSLIMMEKLKEKRVILISNVTSISMSKFIDNILVIHEAAHDVDGDLVLESDRKIEILQHLKAVRKDLVVNVVSDVEILIKKGEHRHLNWVEEADPGFFTVHKCPPDTKTLLVEEKKDKTKATMHVLQRKIANVNAVLNDKEKKKLKTLGFIKSDGKDVDEKKEDGWGTWGAAEDKKGPTPTTDAAKKAALNKGMGTFAASSPLKKLAGKKATKEELLSDAKVNPLEILNNRV